MFEYMKKHNQIVVTGIPRSGTNICAKMISHDTGHPFNNDTIFDLFNIEKFTCAFGKRERQFVLQTAGLTRFVHGLPEWVAVVFVKRNWEDIHKSMKRIKWKGFIPTAIQYCDMYRDFRKPFSPVVYAVWEKQKEYIKYWYEVEYEELKQHPLWVPPEDRIPENENTEGAFYEYPVKMEPDVAEG